MQATLPREMRDMIYFHIITSVYAEFGSKCPVGHHLRVAFVGENMQCEMAESWYRTSLFTVDEKYNETRRRMRTGRVLEEDVFGMGFIPDQLVSNLQVIYTIDRTPSFAKHRFNARSVYKTIRETTTLARKLELLTSLPYRVHFTAVVKSWDFFDHGYLSVPVLVQHLLSKILSKLQKTKKVGKTLKIIFLELDDLEFNAEDALLRPQAWLERIEEAVDAISTPPKFPTLTLISKETGSSNRIICAEAGQG
jgi:hypothetical protein